MSKNQLQTEFEYPEIDLSIKPETDCDNEWLKQVKVGTSVREFEYVELLEVAVRVGCPGNCIKYCPQEIMLNAYANKQPRYMRLSDFKRILSTVPRHVYLDFAGLTEPFSNPEFLDMAEYANKEGFQYGVKTTFLGASADDVKRLSTLSPCCVFVHMPDFVHLNFKPTQQYVDAWFACLKYIRNAQYMTMNNLFATNSREVTARGQARTRSGFGQCYRRDHPQMLVFPNGETVICCIDIKMENVVGNLLVNSYANVRANFLSKHTYPICASCSYNVSVPHYYMRKIIRKVGPKIVRATSLWKEHV